MRYHVTYLASGKRSTFDLDAADAASAVAAVATLPTHDPRAFELLSVVPAHVPPLSSDSHLASVHCARRQA